MIKIGISTDYQRRSKDYKNTYYSQAGNKSYVSELENWETDLAIGDLQRFEKELKQEFIHANTQGSIIKRALRRNKSLDRNLVKRKINHQKI